MDRNLALEMVRVTEAAALHSALWVGKGNEKKADEAAVFAMRKALSSINIKGTVVIGEGERDEAPMLFIGERVGQWGEHSPEVDIALDPLEGTTICARGDVNALSVIAVGKKGALLHAPDTYMMKIATSKQAKDAIDLRLSVKQNILNIADALDRHPENLTVIILDRKRHEGIIKELREIGCRIYLIRDGDVQGAISAAVPDTGVDVLVGIGGAPEGVLAACALKCLGGGFQGKLYFRNDEEIERAKKMGISDIEKIYTIDEIAKGDVMFAATGVTEGTFLKGVRFFKGGAKTHSVVMRSKTGTIRFIEAFHYFDRKPVY